MSEKLGIGDTFPKMTINLVDGRTLDLPDGLDAKYRIFLFLSRSLVTILSPAVGRLQGSKGGA